MNIKKYNTIILDCDGVIFDSNFLKIEAFRKTYDELGFSKTQIDKFVDFMKNNFGISRYKFAEYFIIEILNKKFDQMLFKNIIELYSKKSYELYFEANFTKYLLEFLDKYKDKNLFIASGGDQKELRKVFGKRDLDKYFVDIFGSPTKKSEIVKSIVLQNENSIMIGDAKSDMQAAKENNIDFVFMGDYSTNKAMQKDTSLNSINNLGDLI